MHHINMQINALQCENNIHNKVALCCSQWNLHNIFPKGLNFKSKLLSSLYYIFPACLSTLFYFF